MTSLSLQDIGLKPTQLKAVVRRAKKEGKTPSEFVRSLIERELLAASSFDEILKPIRAGFDNSRVTDDEIETLVTHARNDLRAHSRRRARK
jgi:hypothetical protein